MRSTSRAFSILRYFEAFWGSMSFEISHPIQQTTCPLPSRVPPSGATGVDSTSFSIAGRSEERAEMSHALGPRTWQLNFLVEHNGMFVCGFAWMVSRDLSDGQVVPVIVSLSITCRPPSAFGPSNSKTREEHGGTTSGWSFFPHFLLRTLKWRDDDLEPIRTGQLFSDSWSIFAAMLRRCCGWLFFLVKLVLFIWLSLNLGQ